MSNDPKYVDDESESRARRETHHPDPADAGRQLELQFASEVAGASWSDQRAHSEVIDSLVERLRRRGL